MPVPKQTRKRKRKQKQKVERDAGKVVLVTDPTEVAKILEKRKKQLIEQKERRRIRKQEKPYKVRFPGYRPDGLRQFKDPRLGTAQRRREAFFKSHPASFAPYDGKSDVDETETESDSDSEDAIETETVQCTFAKWASIVSDFGSGSKSDNNGPIKRSHRRAVRNEARYLKKQDCVCADEAVKIFNLNHGTNFEISETLGSYDTFVGQFWYHCGFRAVDPRFPSSPKLFFAELKRINQNKLEVVCCKILEEGQRHRRGCAICSGPLMHPVGGFEVGN